MPSQSTVNTTETFGNYLLLKKIGTGGMAELYLARQNGVRGFERVLAIKRILPHLTEDGDFIEMFINEAKLAAQITHPHVAQVYDFGAVDGVYYMAMEYVMGKSLSYVLSAGKKREYPIPFRHALYITAKIAAGLDHAYRGKTVGGEPLGIIHRDISPQNILVAYNGDVKLVDFGIAKAASSSTHTQTGIIKGKLSYLSPEQAWGKRVDHRSDLFSLGIVAHEMLTGERLFKGENEFVTLERVRAADVPPPSSVKPALPKEIDPVILKALAKDPEDRYPTGHAFQEALETIFHQLDPRPSPKDLSEYIHRLFEKEIGQDVAEFKQVTALTKPPVAPKPAALTPSPVSKKSSIPEKSAPPQVTKGNGMAIGISIMVALVVISAGIWYFFQRASTSPAPPVALSPGVPAATEKPVIPPAAPVPPATVIDAAPAPSAPTPAVEPIPQPLNLKTASPDPQPIAITPTPKAASIRKPPVNKKIEKKPPFIQPKEQSAPPPPSVPIMPAEIPPVIETIKPVVTPVEPPKTVEKVVPPPPAPPAVARELPPPPQPAVKTPRAAPKEEAPLPILP
jgi:serine/threonine protein kinase